jgi:hypothetical protein
MHDVTRTAFKHKWTEDELAKRFQTIEPRWEKRKKRRPKIFIWWRQRWRDLRTTFEQRDGWLIEQGDIDEDLMWGKAQTVGRMLGLTAKERTMWKITTIRACDQTTKQAAAASKAKKRDRERARRKAAGATPRKLSLSQTKPWEDDGVSRRTWERHRDANSCVTQIRANHLPPTCWTRICDTSGAALPETNDAPGSATLLTNPESPDPARLRPENWPDVAASLGYLLRLWEYRKLTSGGIGKIVPGLAACSELRRVAA